MGIGNFLDNFIGGFAFGMLANNPFFGAMRGWGFGGCCCSYPMIDIYNQNYQFNSLFDETYANSFPQNIDFSGVFQSIWDTATDPNSEYNKRMWDMISNSNSQQLPLCTNVTPQLQYDMPFSSYFFSTPYTHYYSGYQAYQEPIKTDSEEIKDKKETVESKSEIASSKKTNSNSKNHQREFESVYASLGITDTRFQKIFEECVLSINEGRKKGRDYNIFDVKAMNKNGVLQPTYDEYRKNHNLPIQDVSKMTMKEMCDIYYTMYYVEGGAKDIKDDRLALYVFDSDVNMGVGTGKKLLKKSQLKVHFTPSPKKV